MSGTSCQEGMGKGNEFHWEEKRSEKDLLYAEVADPILAPEGSGAELVLVT